MSDSPLAAWFRAQHGAGEDDDAAGDTVAGDGGVLGVLAAGLPPPPGPGPDIPRPDRRRTRRLGVLAALPWAVAVCLALAVVTPAGAPAPPAGASGGEADGGDPAVERRADGGDPGAERRAGAAAVVAVRTAAAHEGRRYVDLAVPEEVRWIGSGAVVTVAAVLLEGDGDRWHRTAVARFAVAVGLAGDRAVALGDPWLLPAADPAPPRGDGWAPAPIDVVLVADALAAAGYADIDVEAVEAHDEWPGVYRARVVAVAPTEQERRRHEPWLREGPPVALLGAGGWEPAAHPAGGGEG